MPACGALISDRCPPDGCSDYPAAPEFLDFGADHSGQKALFLEGRFGTV
jgi:hypothetical protein